MSNVATCKIILADSLTHRGIVHTSEWSIRAWFDILNLLIFNGKLPPFDAVVIKRLRHVNGRLTVTMDYHSNTFLATLTIRDKFKCRKDFIEILAHEMVHLWQVLFAGPSINVEACNHSKTFFQWKERFKSLGLGLRKEYDI